MSRPSILNCSRAQMQMLASELHGVSTRDLLFAAGAVNNLNIGRNLGSSEFAIWCEGRRAADPNFKNPFWREKG